MHAAITFNLMMEPEHEQEAVARLAELIELINMDKEEQAIDGDEYVGNAKDYPDWLKASFRDQILVEELLDFCELEPEDLADWDFESWYEDLVECQTYQYSIEPADAPGRYMMYFQADDEHYGGDMSNAWMALAIGGTALEATGALEDNVDADLAGEMSED